MDISITVRLPLAVSVSKAGREEKNKKNNLSMQRFFGMFVVTAVVCVTISYGNYTGDGSGGWGWGLVGGWGWGSEDASSRRISWKINSGSAREDVDWLPLRLFAGCKGEFITSEGP